VWNPNIYNAPGIYWQELTQEALAPSLPDLPLTIIGEVPGSVSVTEQIAMRVSATELTYSIVDEGANAISLTNLSGTKTFVRDVDYVVVARDDTYNTRLRIKPTNPSVLNCTAAPSGGALAANDYYYYVTAVSTNGLETNGGVSCNASVAASGGQIALSWSAVVGAASYNIYRGTGSEVPTFLVNVSGATSYTDDGSLTPDGITTVPAYTACMVTYSYTQADLYDVQLFQDMDDIEAFYGAATDENTGLLNCKLSFAAKMANNNGCSYIQCVAVQQGASLSEWQAALNKLRAEELVDIIVPLYFNTTFFGNCEDFIADMNESGKFPFFVLGGSSEQNIDDIKNAAATIRNEAIIMTAYPTVEYFNDISNSTFDINGFYVAAGIAGRMKAQPVYIPMTRKTISGVYSVPKLAPETMNYYTTQGLFMMHNKGGAVEVRHGVTTSITNTAQKEPSVVRAKYEMLRQMINDLDNVIVGEVLDEFTIVSTKSVVAGRLESLKDARVISNYSELKARLNPQEPTRIDVKFKYQPSWPINYVVIEFSIDTDTGNLSLTA